MVSTVHVGRALESLRNSNYNTVSAMGEVIDNSIEADAKNIRIQIKKEEIRSGKYDYTEVGFADDGKGMNEEILNKCLQLGFSERYNDRNGIGRFGVGMTLGAITQCTRIEVFSKPRGGEWYYTYIDINETKNDPDATIPTPERKNIPSEYANLVENHGTLVIWKNWDREDEKIEEMKVWIGRTYRKFIGQEIVKNGKVVKNNNLINIFLDGEKISPLDPLYAIQTKYNKETSELQPMMKLEEVIDQKFDPPADNKVGKSGIEITFSLLPENWRYKRGIGASGENIERRVHQNEGISILRNGREVFYGHIPYFDLNDETRSRSGFIDMDRYWGCEIEFSPHLDHWFSVKNIKVGAKPLPELRKKLEMQMKDNIYDLRKAIRKVWTDATAKEKMESGAFSGTDIAAETLSKTNVGKKLDQADIDKVILDAGETRQAVIEELQLKMLNQEYTFVKSHDIDRGSNFVDIATHGSVTLLTLNMKHAFFQKFYETLDKLDSKNISDSNINEFKQEIETMFHLLMGSYAVAEKDIDPDKLQTRRDFSKKMMHNWTYALGNNIENMSDTEI